MSSSRYPRSHPIPNLYSSGGGNTERFNIVLTTASLADGATENGTVELADTGVLIQVDADKACWVRLYGTAAERTADSGRVITDDPTVPVLADLIYIAGHLTIPTAPPIWVVNRDDSQTGLVYYTIVNKSGSTGTVTVTFTLDPQ